MSRVVLAQGEVITKLSASWNSEYTVKFDPPFVVPKTGVYLLDYEAGTIVSDEDLGEDE